MTIQPVESQTVQGHVVQPAAYAGPVASSVFAVGQVLKDVIHNTSVYRSEPEVLKAITAIDSFISAFIKPSEVPAVATGDERATIEDVSLRVPPRPVNTPGPIVNQVIDYDKLAAAIVRQQAAQMSAPPEMPAQ